MRDDLVIRAAEADDAPAMLSLLEPIIRAGDLTAMTAVSSPAEQRRFIARFPRDGVFLVALAEGRIVGMQDVLLQRDEPRVGEISTFVALDAARRGIGRALFQRVLLICHDRGIDTLRAVIRAENRGARAFYATLGFRCVTMAGSRAENSVVLVQNIHG